MIRIIKNSIIVMLWLSACTPTSPQATITPTPLPTDTVTPLPTATATPQPTPTPDRFSADALTFIPHTTEEIGESVEVRSPIDDPEGYKEDITKVLAVIHEQILPNYLGDVLNAGGGQIGVMYDSHVISFNHIQLTPIASVNFDWANNDGKVFNIPILFFAAKDSMGEFTYSILLDPVRDYINTMGFVDNPAPDWHMSEIIKKFPMNIINDGSFETFYSLHPSGDDEFTTDYFQASELIISGAGNEIGGAYWNLLGDGGIFNRDCELLSVVTRGGQ